MDDLNSRLNALIEECRRHETALSKDFTHKTLVGLVRMAARIGANDIEATVLNAYEHGKLDEHAACEENRLSLVAEIERLRAGIVARVAVEVERERDAIAAGLDRFLAMGDKHGRVPTVALVRSVQADIRARGGK